MINHMAKRGADVIYGTMNPPRARLRPRQRGRAEAGAEPGAAALLRADPRRVPAACQAREAGQHLRHAGLEETFIMESGDTLEIDEDGARKGEKVTVGRVCIDSARLDEVVEELVIRDRRHLSEDGFVMPIIAINKHTGAREACRRSSAAASCSMEDGAEVLQEARQVVAKTLETSTRRSATDWGVMKEKIRADLKRFS
jgi:ribonuclease J